MTDVLRPAVLREDAPVGAAITTAVADTDGRRRPVQIPKSRYTSPEFFARELEEMWTRTWHIACSVDHVAETGDVYEYRFGPYSVIVVRGDDDRLRAFQNVCRHRGNSLCTGAAHGLGELRCPYHRWSWDLQGRLREVPSRKGFGVLPNDELPLVEAAAGTWGPIVFVNLDRAAMPLEEYIEGVPADAAWLGPEDFRCTAMVSTTVQVNWKVIVDGFSETYHVQGIHPEMLASIDDINAAQTVWGHTSKSEQDYGVPSPRLGGRATAQEVWDSFVVTQGQRMGVTEPGPMPAVGRDQTVTDLIASGIRATQAARGVDLSAFDTRAMLMLNQYNLFPNATVLISPDLLSVLLGRPGTRVDEADFVLLHFERAAGPDAPRARPFDVVLPPEHADFGMVLSQDYRILEGMQRGLRQPGLTHLSLSGEECRVINTHRNLERYLRITPTEIIE